MHWCNRRLWDESNECFFSLHLKWQQQRDSEQDRLDSGAWRGEAWERHNYSMPSYMGAKSQGIKVVLFSNKILRVPRMDEQRGKDPGQQSAYTCYLNWRVFAPSSKASWHLHTERGWHKTVQISLLSTNMMLTLSFGKWKVENSNEELVLVKIINIKTWNFEVFPFMRKCSHYRT